MASRRGPVLAVAFDIARGRRIRLCCRAVSPETPTVDDELRALVGQIVEAPPSWTGGARARFKIESRLGDGGTGVAFLALRQSETGESPHVIKIFRPALIQRAPEIAEVSRRKEHASMRRLNERVPPSPYIVRMTDVGELLVSYGNQPINLPWIASEYINGGPEGTTLTERIARSVEVTGSGFDAERALRTITCIVEGVAAIHECGVIHRDLKPDNVLLCGFAENETAKITDFGVARAQGLDLTFGPQPVGTIGYAAPEQLGLLQAPTSEATDVFAMGVLLYRILTTDEYFRKIPFAQLAMRSDDGPDPRPHLKDAKRLHPELARDNAAVSELDAAIRKATSVRPERRFQTARAFGDAVTTILRNIAKPSTIRGRRIATRERLKTILLATATKTTWTTRHRPGDDRLLRAMAWEPDGRGLAIGTDELAFWDGHGWFPIAIPAALRTKGLTGAARVSAGRFVLLGGEGTIVELHASGWGEPFSIGDPRLVFERSAGDPDDLLLLVGAMSGTPLLYVTERRAWRAPLAIPYAASINGVAPLSETSWVLIGRAMDGTGYVAVYDSIKHVVTPIGSPCSKPLIAVAGDVDGVAYGVGPAGTAVELRVQQDGSLRMTQEWVGTQRNLSAVAIDPAGVAWAAAPGRILKRTAQSDGTARWEVVHELDWTVPALGLLAAGGGVVVMTIDGAILEGRDERPAIPVLREGASGP
ncbi:MAG: serine/threonine-protein kinase [Polyangiales bacterium]